MKTIRRILAFALVLMLTMSLGVNAIAVDAKYQLTRDFVSQVTGVEGLSCTIGDVVSDSTGNYELVKVDYEGELSAYTSYITMLFAEDESEVQLYMYNLINFSEDKLSEMMTVVNDLNHRATGIKLFVDTSDNSVTAEMYQLLPEENGADLAIVALGFMIGITDSVFEQLQSYAV